MLCHDSNGHDSRIFKEAESNGLSPMPQLAKTSDSHKGSDETQSLETKRTSADRRSREPTGMDERKERHWHVRTEVANEILAMSVLARSSSALDE